MTGLPRTTGSEGDSTKYWGYALLLLAAVSAFFLVLRFSGRAFTAPEFEMLIVYVPTVVCLMVCATKMGRLIQR